MPDTAHRLTAHCYVSSWFCEMCGNRGAQVVVRDTRFGPGCMDLCPTCRSLPEPLQVRTPIAANDHKQHLTRARERGELPA